MTSHKTISSLSIAAIALMAIAVPSFAQAQADRDAQSSNATQASEQTIVSSAQLSAVLKSGVAPIATSEVERAPVSNATRAARQPLLASAFKVKSSFTSATSSHTVSPQVMFNAAGPNDPTAKKQFRSDDYAGSSGRKLVTFVPSRGQKLPE